VKALYAGPTTLTEQLSLVVEARVNVRWWVLKRSLSFKIKRESVRAPCWMEKCFDEGKGLYSFPQVNMMLAGEMFYI
jgi:hypothetical protein